MTLQRSCIFLSLIAFLALSSAASAVRLKDIARVGSVRDNQLIGTGLVVGLNGTGDGGSATFTGQGLAAFFRRSGLTVEGDIDVDNVAMVVVTATLPPFSRPGQTIDVMVSSVGDAESLQGGTLLMTPLRAANGQTYVVAQGAVAIGGFSAGQAGSSVQQNHPTVGKIANGGTVEREVAIDLNGKRQIMVSLNNPDFITATRIGEAINRHMGARLAHAVDAATVSVLIPGDYADETVRFIATIELVPVHPDQPAKVVLSERTGTVVMGEHVRISTVAVAHGALTVVISAQNEVSQAQPFAPGGQTMPVQNAGIQVEEERSEIRIVEEGVTITELVSALNALGVSPRDLISILQTIKAAGALQADLEIL